jgi:hypothetical protein
MAAISPAGTSFPVTVNLDVGSWLTWGNTNASAGGFGTTGEVGFNNYPLTQSGDPQVINPDPSHARTFTVHLFY